MVVDRTRELTAVDWPASSEPSTGGREAGVGASIGRYLVIEQIGVGGMGRVFRAYDPKLGREVAVKRLRIRDESGSTGSARMLREAKAMAQLSHPNVVPVFDVDADGGVLFIAMELVRGETLHQWMERGPHPWRTVLDVFLEAGRGLAAAHAQGIVHRDFKPANVLVGEGFANAPGRVRVSDFGLARAIEGASGSQDGLTEGYDDAALPASHVDLGGTLTEHGAIIGTPTYMAPEQHGGGTIDARTDQYAFCSALWEALFGRAPFTGDTIAALVESKRGPAPKPPAGAKVPSAVTAAVVRGLAVDADARWPSMDALSSALRQTTARARRWHVLVPAAVLGGAAVLAVVQRDRPCERGEDEIAITWNDDARAGVRTALSASHATYASSTWERIEPLLDGYAADWAEMHRDACEAVKVRHEQSDEALDLRMQCLAARRQDLAAVVEMLERSDVVTTENAIELASGIVPLTRCADVIALREHAPPPAQAEAVQDVRARIEYSRLEARAGALEAGLTIAADAKVAADALDYAPVRAEAELRLGMVLATLDRIDEAQPLLERAMQTALEHRQSHVAARAAIELTGVLVAQQGRALESQWLAKAALGLAEGDGTDVVLVADAMLAVGNVFADRELELEAEPYFRGAVERLERSLGPDHPDLVGPLLSWASMLNIAKREDEAERICRRALELAEVAFGPDHPQTASALEELAWLQLGAHRFAESEELSDRALAIYEAAFGPEHQSIRGALSRRAGAMAYQGRYDEAIAGLEEAMRRLGDSVPQDHPSRANLLHNLAQVNSMRGEHERAAELFRRANDIRRRLGMRPALAASVGALGQELVHLGRLDEAEDAFAEAWQLNVAIHADDGMQSGMALIQLGKIARKRGDMAKALEKLEAAWAVERDGPDDLVKAEAALELGDARWEHGKERVRARGLVENARDTLLRDGRGKGGPLHERIETWLAAHSLGARPSG